MRWGDSLQLSRNLLATTAVAAALLSAGCSDEPPSAHPDTLKTELGYWALEKAKRLGMCQALEVQATKEGEAWVRDDGIECMGGDYATSRETPICEEFLEWLDGLALE